MDELDFSDLKPTASHVIKLRDFNKPFHVASRLRTMVKELREIDYIGLDLASDDRLIPMARKICTDSAEILVGDGISKTRFEDDLRAILWFIYTELYHDDLFLVDDTGDIQNKKAAHASLSLIKDTMSSSLSKIIGGMIGEVSPNHCLRTFVAGDGPGPFKKRQTELLWRNLRNRVSPVSIGELAGSVKMARDTVIVCRDELKALGYLKQTKPGILLKKEARFPDFSLNEYGIDMNKE